MISTLPVVDISATALKSSVTLPQFADGGGWTTRIILVNPSDSSMSGSIRLTDGNGQALQTLPFSISQRTSFKFVTAGTGAAVQSGSVQIAPDSGSAAPVAEAIFSFKSGGITVSEAAVPATSGSALRMYVEASGAPGTAGAIQSGVAVSNLSSTPATVNFDLTGLDGTPLATGALNLPANGQAAKFLNEILPSVPQSMKGILRITTSGSSIAVVGLRGRYNERGDFLITTTPPAVETASPSANVSLFPHIVDAGSYTTQFILFDGAASGSMNGDVRFIDQTGNALGLSLN